MNLAYLDAVEFFDVSAYPDTLKVRDTDRRITFSFEIAKVAECPGCGGDTRIHYFDRPSEGGTEILTLGTECITCGEDSLHIAY